MGCGASSTGAPSAGASSPPKPAEKARPAALIPAATEKASQAKWEAAEQLFKLWDVNGNGELETSEQMHVFKTFQEQGDVSFDVLIESLADKDADGSANTHQDQGEFVTWLLKVTGSLDSYARGALVDKMALCVKAEQLFKLCDVSGNGKLETSEQMHVFKTFQEQGDVSFDALIESLADKDADGSANTHQDQGEFVTWLLKVTGLLDIDDNGKAKELIEKLTYKLNTAS